MLISFRPQGKVQGGIPCLQLFIPQTASLSFLLNSQGMLLIANTQSVFHSFIYATDKTLIERLVYSSPNTVPGVSLPAAHETDTRRGQAVYGQRKPLQRVTGATIKGNGATARV